MAATRTLKPPAGRDRQHVGRGRRVLAALADRVVRSVLFAQLSIPCGLAVSIWKVGVGVASLSLLLISTGLFTVVTAGAKFIAVRAYHGSGRRRTAIGQASYRAIALVLLIGSGVFVLSSVLVALNLAPVTHYSETTATLIAAVAFFEIGFALPGSLIRRHPGSVLEAIKLTNLAGALILLALTHSALNAAMSSNDLSLADGLVGIVCGCGAIAIGVFMLLRARSAPSVSAARGSERHRGDRRRQSPARPDHATSGVTIRHGRHAGTGHP